MSRLHRRANTDAETPNIQRPTSNIERGKGLEPRSSTRKTAAG
jgi:hypothetical protein